MRQGSSLRRKYTMFGRAIVDILVIVAVAVTAWEYYERRRPLPPPIPPQEPVAVNEKTNIPDVGWERARLNVVIGFTTTCSYCAASAGFFKKLSTLVRGQSDARLLFVAPESRSIIAEWMQSRGIHHYEHVQRNPFQYGLRLTPTLAIVDSKGIVTDLAVGKLSTDEETAIIDRLNGRRETPVILRTALFDKFRSSGRSAQ